MLFLIRVSFILVHTHTPISGDITLEALDNINPEPEPVLAVIEVASPCNKVASPITEPVIDKVASPESEVLNREEICRRYGLGYQPGDTTYVNAHKAAKISGWTSKDGAVWVVQGKSAKTKWTKVS